MWREGSNQNHCIHSGPSCEETNPPNFSNSWSKPCNPGCSWWVDSDEMCIGCLHHVNFLCFWAQSGGYILQSTFKNCRFGLKKSGKQPKKGPKHTIIIRFLFPMVNHFAASILLFNSRPRARIQPNLIIFSWLHIKCPVGGHTKVGIQHLARWWWFLYLGDPKKKHGWMFMVWKKPKKNILQAPLQKKQTNFFKIQYLVELMLALTTSLEKVNIHLFRPKPPREFAASAETTTSFPLPTVP